MLRVGLGINFLGSVAAMSGGSAAPATLSAPTWDQNYSAPTSAHINVTTDTASGTLYWVLTTSSTSPTAAQIIAGQNNTGTAASASGNAAVTATGVQNFVASGLTDNSVYFAYFEQVSAGGNSNIPTVTVQTSMTLSAGTATATGTTTATIGVTTDDGAGSLYWIVSTDVNPPTISQIQNGFGAGFATPAAHGTIAVAATGAQSASVTGLTTATHYYTYWQQQDGPNSPVYSGPAFTTS